MMNEDQKLHFELGFSHARDEAYKLANRKSQNCSDSCVDELVTEILALPLPEGIK